MFEKLKKMFKKKDNRVKNDNSVRITIVINDETYENVSSEEAEVLFKKLSEGLKRTS